MTIAPDRSAAVKVSEPPSPVPAPAKQGRNVARVQKPVDFPGMEETYEALHVRIKTGIDDKLRTPGVQVGSDVWVNDKLRRAGTWRERSAGTLGRDPIPLSPPQTAADIQETEGESYSTAPPPPTHFTMLGELRLACPSYLHILPPVASDAGSRLWVTNFGIARTGTVLGIDLTGTQQARRVTTEFQWPNAVEHDVTGGSILVADGFLVPGKSDGAVADPGGPSERVARISPQKSGGWFYHRAVFVTIQGHKGILTARA
ncbi:hypothetical protein T484DRAFT_1763724, partial [Baffinella frigidus]